jgi:hypothetical protein
MDLVLIDLTDEINAFTDATNKQKPSGNLRIRNYVVHGGLFY